MLFLADLASLNERLSSLFPCIVREHYFYLTIVVEPQVELILVGILKH